MHKICCKFTILGRSVVVGGKNTYHWNPCYYYI